MHRITRIVPDLRDRVARSSAVGCNATNLDSKKKTVRFRRPVPEDAEEMERICKESGTLEVNSRYAFLMMIAYFGDSGCVIAEHAGADGKVHVVGYLMGFPQLPGKATTGFVWQYGVDMAFRGLSIGPRLLAAFAEGLSRHGVNYLEATIAQNNAASKRAWQRFSRDLGAPCTSTLDQAFAPPLFATRGKGAPSVPEELYRTGPFSREQAVALVKQLGDTCL